jgi:hydroxymethylglutaryl-CoA reductase (NADPH)
MNGRRTIEDVRVDLQAGKVKASHLEQEMFASVCGAQAAHAAEACREAARMRCEEIERTTGSSLPLVKACPLDTASVAHGELLTGIEMKVGAVMIPLGMAGPVTIHGERAKGSYYVPLATNEAALVAGVQRGIKAINMSGGVNVIVTFDGMARAPLIEAPDIRAARALCERLSTDVALLAELRAQVKDPFVRLAYIKTYQLGTKVFLRLVHKTGDAMGMNGVTKASADIVRVLLSKLPGWKLLTISGNLCTDKKAAHVNVLEGRGKSVHTEVVVPEEVLRRVFKGGVTSAAVQSVVFHKCYLGSCLSGTVTGFNVNAANAVAAFFAATGQDLAQIVTSASAFTQAEAVAGGLRFMVSLPSLEVATVGGGTAFGTAREVLRLMGCHQAGGSVDDTESVVRLAEVCAAAVTALDLNTACAQAAGYEMADSHVALARGEKDA